MSSMKRLGLTVFFVSLCVATVALAMGGKHSDSGSIGTIKQGWPAALPAAINSPGRVAGHWVNANDEFFYRGDGKAFGEFVRRLAETKLPLTLVLHTGPQPRRSLLWGEEPRVGYDWALLVGEAGWVAPEWKLNFDDPQTKFAVRVDAWLDGGLTVDALDLPAGVRLSVERGSTSTTQPATREADPLSR